MHADFPRFSRVRKLGEWVRISVRIREGDGSSVAEDKTIACDEYVIITVATLRECVPSISMAWPADREHRAPEGSMKKT
jgi:hypothetical protein